MAKCLNVKQSYLSGIERGHRKPPKYFRDAFMSEYHSVVTGDQLQELDNILKEK